MTEQEHDPDVVELAHRLLDAARAGDRALLEQYLDAGAPVDLTDPQGNSLLMLAAYHGHAARSGRWQRAARTSTGSTTGPRRPWPERCSRASARCLEVLVAAGADPDLGSPSARATAVFFERPDLGALLDRAGAQAQSTTSTKPDSSQ